jgi:predicted PurR-regulated permease PerM
VLANVATSVIAGAATFVWCVVFNVPYPLLLGIVGALVAIPVAAAVQLLAQELLFSPRSMKPDHDDLIGRLPRGFRLSARRRPGG